MVIRVNYVCFGLVVVLVLAGFAALSCSGDSCTLNCNGDLRFPLALGYTWQYVGQDHLSNFRPDNDSIATVPSDTLVNYILTVTVASSDTLDDNTIVYFLHEVRSMGDSLVAESYQCYGNKADGLYYYENLSTGVPQLIFKHAMGTGNTGIRADFARKSLEYPLQEGLRWEYTNGFGYGPEGAIYKDVIGIGEQNVPDGNYECYAINWLWENLPDAEHTEYVSDVGLVRVYIQTRNLRYTTPTVPNGIGLIDLTSELKLSSGPF